MPLIRHFPEIDLIEGDLSAVAHCNVSIFDHWLTADECDAAVMRFDDDLDGAKQVEYLGGENRFLRFYRHLAERGAVSNRDGSVVGFESMSSDLEAIIVASLREERLMDVYFCGLGVRVLGRYDRTDMVILDSADSLPALIEAVAGAGLFVLP